MKRIRPSQIPYADPARLLIETFDSLLPPRAIGTAEFTAASRWVKSAVGGHLVRWDHGDAPYLVEPMEALDHREHDTVAIVGPGACGKTMVAENWLLKSIAEDPADLLWYMQTDPTKDAYVKGRIEPMLEAHDKLIGHLRHGRDSVEFKRFRAMRAEFLAFTPSNLINKHVTRIVADEVDAYDKSMGDPMAWLDPRRQAAGADSMLLAISHPDQGLPLHMPVDRQRGIMSLYARGDRRTWWWPCPHCGGYSSPNPGTHTRMLLDYDDRAPLDEIEAMARLKCPHCQGKIEDHVRRDMNRAARWVGLGEEIDADGRVTGERHLKRIAAFWIHGLMSPFVMGGIGGMARARVEAERKAEADADDTALRTVMAKTWGEPPAPLRSLGTLDPEVLKERVEPALALGEIPPGVRFFTVSADAQGNRFEVLRRGWGVDGESWVLDYARRPAEPATSPEDWLQLFTELTRPLPLADGSGRVMQPRCVMFDAYGLPGTTERAYEAWMRWRQKGLARKLGRIDGRDAWNILPSKGERGADGRLVVSYPDARSDRRAAARGQVPVAIFNSDSAKNDLSGHLQRMMPGPGYVHFPAALHQGFPDFFDQLTAEARNRLGRWEKRSDGARNEVLDLMVGCHLGARLHGMRRLNWERPPAWADEWDRNSLVGLPAPPEPEAAPPLPVVPDAAGSPVAEQPRRPLAAAVVVQPRPRVAVQVESRRARYA